MESVVQNEVNSLLLMVGVVLILGLVSLWVSKLLRLPDTVVFILAGVIAGPEVLDFIRLDDGSLANLLILTFGASYILYDGGREIEFHVLKKVSVSLISLATLGVLVTTLVMAVPISYLFHVNFVYSFLIGSIIASTDPSVLVPLFKKLNISPKLKQLIIAESALNDAMAAVLTAASKAAVLGGAFSLLVTSEHLLHEAFFGLLIGGVVGLAYAFLVSSNHLSLFTNETTQVSLTAVIIAYVMASYVHASGYMAAFLVGLICGNMGHINFHVGNEAKETHTRFKDELTLILRFMIFVLLGTHIHFGVIIDYWWQLLLTIAVFIFVSRPLSVIISTIWDFTYGWTWRERFYLMWVRETGVIPAALAGTVVASGVENAEIITGITSAAILITLGIQASTASYVAHKLGLVIHPSGAKKH